MKILSDRNHSQLSALLSKALLSFENKTHLNNSVIRLAQRYITLNWSMTFVPTLCIFLSFRHRVLEVPYDAARGNWLNILKSDIKESIAVHANKLKQLTRSSRALTSQQTSSSSTQAAGTGRQQGHSHTLTAAEIENYADEVREGSEVLELCLDLVRSSE